MKNYVQDGVALDLAVPYDVASGAAFKIGAIIAVAACAGVQANGDVVAGYVQGVYDLASDTGTAWAVGDRVYWDDTNKWFTKTTTSNTKAGYVVQAKAAGDVTGRIRLVPSI